MGSKGNTLVGVLGGKAKSDFKVSTALYFSSPESYLNIFKFQFNRKTVFKYKTVEHKNTFHLTGCITSIPIINKF